MMNQHSAFRNYDRTKIIIYSPVQFICVHSVLKYFTGISVLNSVVRNLSPKTVFSIRYNHRNPSFTSARRIEKSALIPFLSSKVYLELVFKSMSTSCVNLLLLHFRNLQFFTSQNELISQLLNGNN